jgi:hypothetical protein
LSTLLVGKITAIKTSSTTNVYVVLLMTVMMVIISDDYDEIHMCIGTPFRADQTKWFCDELKWVTEKQDVKSLIGFHWHRMGSVKVMMIF